MLTDAHIAEALAAQPQAQRRDTIARIISFADSYGFTGFSGDCGAAAIAINRALFAGQGQVIGAANAHNHKQGRFYGHFAVLHDGAYWDADARPKSWDEIESWGMLDAHDPDYGLSDETEAYEVSRIEDLSDAAILALTPGDADDLAEALRFAAARFIDLPDGKAA